MELTFKVPANLILAVLLVVGLSGCQSLSGTDARPELMGTGDLGLIVERATGSVLVINTTRHEVLGRIEGLGDLSHASVVYSRDARYGFVFGRDGGLTKVDLLTRSVVARVIQSGNSIGGAISQNGRYVAVSNYEPGGVKVFDSQTLELVADVPAIFTSGDGEQGQSKTVGLVDAPGNLFVFSLFEAGEIWTLDMSNDTAEITRFQAGKSPYDALITPDGRYYIAGLFGEDGLSLLDLWNPDQGVTEILGNYGRFIRCLTWKAGPSPMDALSFPRLVTIRCSWLI